MKNVYEVLRQKELQVSKLQIEIEALRVVAPLLTEDGETEPEHIQQIRLATGAERNQKRGT